MEELYFTEYLEPLKIYLAKFRESEKQALAHSGKSAGQSHDAWCDVRQPVCIITRQAFALPQFF